MTPDMIRALLGLAMAEVARQTARADKAMGVLKEFGARLHDSEAEIERLRAQVAQLQAEAKRNLEAFWAANREAPAPVEPKP